MKSLKLTFLAFLAICFSLSAQQLQQPLEEIPFSNKGYVLLKSGEVVEGTIRSTTSGRGINQVKMEDAHGIKHTLKAAEIQEFAVAMNGAVRLQYFSERGSSVKKLFSKDQPTAMPKDFIVFRNTSINGEKELLLQLLNSDFDTVFEVYYDPFARKTTALEGDWITWTGDKHRAYFISKQGGPLVKVKKGNYTKAFATLFGDCSHLAGLRKPKLMDIEKHILYYQNYCVFN